MESFLFELSDEIQFDLLINGNENLELGIKYFSGEMFVTLWVRMLYCSTHPVKYGLKPNFEAF